jgi:hypothetical protein
MKLSDEKANRALRDLLAVGFYGGVGAVVGHFYPEGTVFRGATMFGGVFLAGLIGYFLLRGASR